MDQNEDKSGVPSDSVSVLRLSDVIHPDDANSPIARVYYDAQIVLSGDTSQQLATPKVRSGLLGLLTVFEGTPVKPKIEKAIKAVEAGRFYSVICILKPLLVLEQELLGTNVAQTLSVADNFELAKSA